MNEILKEVNQYISKKAKELADDVQKQYGLSKEDNVRQRNTLDKMKYGTYEQVMKLIEVVSTEKYLPALQDAITAIGRLADTTGAETLVAEIDRLVKVYQTQLEQLNERLEVVIPFGHKYVRTLTEIEVKELTKELYEYISGRIEEIIKDSNELLLALSANQDARDAEVVNAEVQPTKRTYNKKKTEEV